MVRWYQVGVQYRSKIVALVSTIIGAVINLGFVVCSLNTFSLVGLVIAILVLSPWLLLGAALRISWRKPSPVQWQAFLSIMLLILSSWYYYQSLVAHYDAMAELVFVIIPLLALPPTLFLLLVVWLGNRKTVN